MGHLHNEVHKAPRPRGCWIYSCPCGSTVAAPGKENLRKRLALSNSRAKTAGKRMPNIYSQLRESLHDLLDIWKLGDKGSEFDPKAQARASSK